MDQVSKAVSVLKKGGVVVFPTDTCYGLAADATSLKAVKKLYRIKGRDFHKPVHVIFPDVTWLSRMVMLDTSTLKLMNRFMPGPVTLVLPLKIEGKTWELLSAGTKTLGVRMPDNKLALDLVRRFGKPITATSANVSGMPDTYAISEIQKQFKEKEGKPDFYLDGGRLKKNKPSTVVLIASNNAKILRQGPVSEKQILNALR